MKNKILDILKQKGNGFKVPKGYFKSVENTVMSKVNETKFSTKEGGYTIPNNYFDSIEDVVFSKLGKSIIEKKKLNVPKGYFDSIEDAIFDRLKTEKVKEESKVIFLSQQIKKVLIPIAVAASLALILILQYNNSNSINSNDIVESDIESWIDGDNIDLNSYEIAEVFNDIELENNDYTIDETILLDYVNGTDIENILLEN